MKKSILGFVSVLALVAGASVAQADADIKIYGANTKPVVAGQLNVGIAAINVGKTVENSNQAVGVNIDVESAQQVRNLDIAAHNNGASVAVQVNGPTLVGGATSISNTNVSVGANVGVKLK
ncbi:MAG: hypothetical protein EON60_08245 [Alphaproteobacteria bacterium]|nr:MAG: hypothetical protein EON60_08245 [Alphaproteobacteria bacterium]